MKRSTLPGTGRRLATRGTAAALATVTAVTVAGMSATPAQSAIGDECPDVAAAVAPGDPVDGKTVHQGTTPSPFTGEVLGVLDDGIAPGLDMILVRLTSPEIDRVGGIWSGMSGSPVYDAAGDLIGAVSYGLSYGASPVAGVTPAADMRALLDEPGPDPAPRLRAAIPDRIGDRMVAHGDATRAQVDRGMSQLEIPLGMAGLGSERRFRQLAKKMELKGFQAVRMGTSAALDATDIVAGGNLATAIAYGDVTFAGIGTATMVCGDEVVGFGHPFQWSGPTTLSLHPADAIYVQEESVGAPFKVANLGGPVGTIDDDRMAGIAGAFGALPTTSTISSHSESQGDVRDGESHVNLPEWVPDVGATHLLVNLDRVFDGTGKGSGDMSYVIDGRREDGSPFSITRSDVYASEYDITYSVAEDLYSVLSRLEYNGAEDITIDDVDTDADVTRDYRHAAISKVSIRKGKKWVPLDEDRRLDLVAGTTARFKVDMITEDGKDTLRIQVPIRRRDVGRRGSLEVMGGNSGYEDEFYYDEEYFSGGARQTFDEVLEDIEAAPHNDDVTVTMRFPRFRDQKRMTVVRTGSTDGTPVDGGIWTSFRIIRGR